MADNVAAIICAAGKSTRFGGNRKKPFVDVGGRAVFLRSVELFDERDDVKQIILAIDPEDEEIVKVKWGANLSFFGVKICFGGEQRFETVQNALKLIGDDIDIVAIHDAARCCLTKQWLDAVITEASKNGAAMLASPVTATLKQVEDMTIAKTIDRSDLYEAQTPQVFKAELIKRAYANLNTLDKATITDDAQLVEALGEKVRIVETDSSNIKVTTPADIPIAAAILKSRPKPKPEGYVGPYAEAQW